jgi:N-methylhydantoinase B/oxoprolinase/acetone carboxylase alpha subunit
MHLRLRGTMNNVTLGGRRPDDGSPFAYYETMGGRNGLPGLSGVHTHMSNTAIRRSRRSNITSLSAFVATRCGKAAAGLAVILAEKASCESMRRCRNLHHVAQRTPRQPSLRSARGRARRLRTEHGRACRRFRSAKVRLELRPGDRLRIETPGGGGFGPATAATGTR